MNIQGEVRRERRIDVEDADCFAACQAWLTTREQLLLKQPHPLLFFTPNLMPLSRRKLHHDISAYLQSVGIPKNRSNPETLRQTAIVGMLQKGMSLEETQAKTGIKTLARLELYQGAALRYAN